MAMDISKIHAASQVVVDPAFVGSTPILNEAAVSLVSAASNVTVDKVFTDTVPTLNELAIAKVFATSQVIADRDFVLGVQPYSFLPSTLFGAETASFANSNRTIASIGSTYTNVLATDDTERDVGVWRWSFLYGVFGGTAGSEDSGFGAAPSSTTTGSYMGAVNTGYGLYENGSLYNNGVTTVGATPALVDGDLVSFVADFDTSDTEINVDIYINGTLEHSFVVTRTLNELWRPGVTVRNSAEISTSNFTTEQQTYTLLDGLAFNEIFGPNAVGIGGDAYTDQASINAHPLWNADNGVRAELQSFLPVSEPGERWLTSSVQGGNPLVSNIIDLPSLEFEFSFAMHTTTGPSIAARTWAFVGLSNPTTESGAFGQLSLTNDNAGDLFVSLGAYTGTDTGSGITLERDTNYYCTIRGRRQTVPGAGDGILQVFINDTLVIDYADLEGTTGRAQTWTGATFQPRCQSETWLKNIAVWNQWQNDDLSNPTIWNVDDEANFDESANPVPLTYYVAVVPEVEVAEVESFVGLQVGDAQVDVSEIVVITQTDEPSAPAQVDVSDLDVIAVTDAPFPAAQVDVTNVTVVSRIPVTFAFLGLADNSGSYLVTPNIVSM